MFFILFINGHS